MFEVSQEEILRCQNVTSSWGGSRYGAFAFTEIGVAMLSGVLSNPRKIWLTNVKLLFNGKDYFIILCRLNNCLVPLPHQKRSLTCWTKGINEWN